MTRLEHLLTILIEECNETAHVASKALRFGLDDVKPGDTQTNERRLTEEFHHIVAMMRMLVIDGEICSISPELQNMDVQAKIIQVEKYLEYSKKKGLLNQEKAEISTIEAIRSEVQQADRLIEVMWISLRTYGEHPVIKASIDKWKKDLKH